MHRYRHLLVLPYLIVFAACGNAAQSQAQFPVDAVIQALIESRVSEERAVGLVVGVMEADGSTRVFAAGDSGTDAKPLGAESVFEIGSITKVFTSIILADMVAKGELALEDPVARYLPEAAVNMPTRAGREITLLDLATHRSALPRMPDNFDPADPSNPFADYTVEQMYAFLSSHELRRDIGAEAEYSNLAVGLLGHTLALVSGQSYEALVHERILEPLNMHKTGIELTDDMQAWLAKGHDPAGNVVSNWDIDTLAGAGALRSDVIDMLKFVAANTGPANGALEKAMRASHAVKNTMGGDTSIGLNWIVTAVGDETVIWHNGGTGGYRTFVGFDPDKGVGVVVLNNSNQSADDIGMHLINANLPLAEAPPPPVDREEIELSESVLQKYVGEYSLSPEFTITITTEEGSLWAQATAQPKFQIFAETETEFFFKVVDAQISFAVDDDGVAKSLLLHQGGADMPALKQ